MGLTDDERSAIVKYRLERAKETLAEVPILFENKLYRTAANRLYYACFYAAIALLLNDGYEARTHNGVRTLLGQHYVKEGKIDDELNHTYRKMFNLRQTGDYDDLTVVTPNEVLDLLEPAQQFITAIENLINKII